MAWTDVTLDFTIKIKNQHLIELRSAIETLEAACATNNVTRNATKNTTVYGSQNSSVLGSNDASYHRSNLSVYPGGMSGGCATYYIAQAKGPCFIGIDLNIFKQVRGYLRNRSLVYDY